MTGTTKGGHVAVIDIGKTNAKLALVRLSDMAEIAVVTRPNIVLPGPPYPHFDVEGHWAFLLDGLSRFHAGHGVSAISITTHGAAGALIAQDGSLAAPILDYEHEGTRETADAYDMIRPPFVETGSPRLPAGLNLGAQLHWQLQRDPTLRDWVHRVVTYPQFWAHRLTGILATDVTSLGCHTDLWNPFEGTFSSLPGVLGLAGKIAPPRKPGDVLGPILPGIAERTGLPVDTPVHCGIHDSNASLLSHLLALAPPFSVVSTGTWVIAMAVGAGPSPLDPARDTLVNVNAFGDPVPSARFMGGREFETVMSGQFAEPTPADLDDVLEKRILLCPPVVRGSGPFPDGSVRWVGEEPRLGTGARTAAVSLYLAMMTATCLGLIGHRGEIVVEGPFSRNDAFCRMLGAATGCGVIAAGGATGTSEGAALLTNPGAVPGRSLPRRTVAEASPALRGYAEAWRAEVV